MDALETTRQWSMKLYDDFAPVRALIEERPELREPIVKAVAEVMNNFLLPNFYGPQHLKGKDEPSNT